MSYSKVNISYVILNYNTFKDTEASIESILKYTDFNIVNLNIIVVDNFSSNNSVSYLKEKYMNKEFITIIESRENLGFAKGNNLGFKYAKYNFSPDFIIMNNSDTEILSADIYEKIINSYSKYKYAVMGPKEKLLNGNYYPYRERIITVDEIKKLISNRKRTIKLCKYNLYYVKKKLSFIKNKIKCLLKICNQNLSEIDLNIERTNVVLHGEFLIFSKIYIDKFDGIDDRTFMYYEEDLLSLRLKKYNLISLYNPNIVIFHKHGSSTNSDHKSQKQRIIIRCEREIRSLMILYDELRCDK